MLIFFFYHTYLTWSELSYASCNVTWFLSIFRYLLDSLLFTRSNVGLVVSAYFHKIDSFVLHYAISLIMKHTKTHTYIRPNQLMSDIGIKILFAACFYMQFVFHIVWNLLYQMKLHSLLNHHFETKTPWVTSMHKFNWIVNIMPLWIFMRVPITILGSKYKGLLIVQL